MATRKKYVVTINDKSGSCASTLFEKMAAKGDITSKPVKELVDEEFTVKGYANCTIETDEKSFTVLYIDTNIGIIHTGSEIFKEAFMEYVTEVDSFRVAAIKTKNGMAYKPVPVMA